MNSLFFTDKAWTNYLYWQTQDKKTLKRINALIKDIQRNAYDGIGKPEALTGNYSGFWSRRIDDKNRLIYRVNGDIVEITSLRNHYEG